MNMAQMHYYLVEQGIATKDEISLVTKINGWNTQSLEDILYVKTGYQCFNQLED